MAVGLEHRTLHPQTADYHSGQLRGTLMQCPTHRMFPNPVLRSLRPRAMNIVQGLFNFKPSVRPVPLEAHIQGYPGKFYCPRMATMNKPTYAAIQVRT